MVELPSRGWVSRRILLDQGGKKATHICQVSETRTVSYSEIAVQLLEIIFEKNLTKAEAIEMRDRLVAASNQ